MMKMVYIRRTANDYKEYLMETTDLSKVEIEALVYLNEHAKAGERIEIEYKKAYKDAYKKGIITKLVNKGYLACNYAKTRYLFDAFGEAQEFNLTEEECKALGIRYYE